MHPRFVVDQHQQVEHPGAIAEEVPAAVRVHGAVRHHVDALRGDGFDDHAGLARISSGRSRNVSVAGHLPHVAAVLVQVDDHALAHDDRAAQRRCDRDDQRAATLQIVLRPRPVD